MMSQTLLPAIIELSEDKQWRVRLAIVEFMPLLAKQLGVEVFSGELEGLCLRWLSDRSVDARGGVWARTRHANDRLCAINRSVQSVRMAAAANVGHLISVFGASWGVTSIVPRAVQLCTDPSYLVRLTALEVIRVIGSAVPRDVLHGALVPAATRLASDAVPNVRFNVARMLQALVPALDAAVIKSTVRARDCAAVRRAASWGPPCCRCARASLRCRVTWTMTSSSSRRARWRRADGTRRAQLKFCMWHACHPHKAYTQLACTHIHIHTHTPTCPTTSSRLEHATEHSARQLLAAGNAGGALR